MLTLLMTLAFAASEPVPADCSLDYDREAELARDVVAFDQTEGQGWRPLYDAECYIDAAELLRDWQSQHEDDLDQTDPRDRSLAKILLWHEAQMWAFGHRNDLALPIFEKIDREGRAASGNAWNLYVDGTLAFLNRDKAALEAAITGLAKEPKPAGWDDAVGADGQPISLPWPQNLDVLEGLLRCWDKTQLPIFAGTSRRGIDRCCCVSRR